jgi:hypothetical protein
MNYLLPALHIYGGSWERYSVQIGKGNEDAVEDQKRVNIFSPLVG